MRTFRSALEATMLALIVGACSSGRAAIASGAECGAQIERTK